MSNILFPIAPDSPTYTPPTYTPPAGAVIVPPFWATNTTFISEVSVKNNPTQVQSGWQQVPGQKYGQVPPAQWENWLRYSAGQWLGYAQAGLKNIHQAGIIQWDNVTTYAQGSFVQVDGNIFMSRADGNFNNAPLATPAAWEVVYTAGSPPIVGVNLNVITTSGNYNPFKSTNPKIYTQFAIIDMIGAGGSGGATRGVSGAEISFGDGGGAGQYVRAFFGSIEFTLGLPFPVQIGVSGTTAALRNTSVGTVVAAGGTNGSGYSTGTGSFLMGAITPGGSGSTLGAFQIPGGSGEYGFYTNAYTRGGKGGDSVFGQGGLGGYGLSAGSYSKPGVTGTGYGSGGGGGLQYLTSPIPIAGGQGGPGVAIITEFYSFI